MKSIIIRNCINHMARKSCHFTALREFVAESPRNFVYSL
jgi:hypothetical protein